MPTYATPSPIDVAVTVQVGRVDVVASDRADTVVTVTPSNPAKAVDRRGADDTRVEFDGNRLTIIGPKPRFSWIGPGPSDSIDLTIEVPTGSRLTADLAVGNLSGTGRLGATRVKSSSGSVTLDVTGDLWVRASQGPVAVVTAEGSVEITADLGQVKVGSAAGDAVIKASHGTVTIGESVGDLEARLSYGDLEVASALGSVTAKTAYGRIDIGEASAGSIGAESGYGEISIGVRAGVASWLDLASKQGRVRNQLDPSVTPDPSEQTVAIRARTQYGDITVHHASSKGSAK